MRQTGLLFLEPAANWATKEEVHKLVENSKESLIILRFPGEIYLSCWFGGIIKKKCLLITLPSICHSNVCACACVFAWALVAMTVEAISELTVILTSSGGNWRSVSWTPLGWQILVDVCVHVYVCLSCAFLVLHMYVWHLGDYCSRLITAHVCV